nr:hypothetical protein [Tanacetum cinerariifolium]
CWCLHVMSLWMFSVANSLTVIGSGLFEVLIANNGWHNVVVQLQKPKSCNESVIALMRDLFSALRVSIAKNRRLIAELDALGQPSEASKPLDYMK